MMIRRYRNLRLLHLLPFGLLTGIGLGVGTVCAQVNKTNGPGGETKTTTFPAFDVVSIRPHPSEDTEMHQDVTSSRYSFRNVPVVTLLSIAYGRRPDEISGGPDWVRTHGYDLEAKISEGDIPTTNQMTASKRDSLLQAVLKDRFHLRVHTESRMLPEYQLVVDRAGLKLEQAANGALQPGIVFGAGKISTDAINLPALAAVLSSIVDRPVRDATGVKGNYRLTLSWDPTEGVISNTQPGSEHRPDIFTAVREQLGLRLINSKGLRDILVIDAVTPLSPN